MKKTIDTYEEFVEVSKMADSGDVESQKAIELLWKEDTWLAGVWNERLAENDSNSSYSSNSSYDKDKDEDDDYEIGSDFYMWTLNND